MERRLYCPLHKKWKQILFLMQLVHFALTPSDSRPITMATLGGIGRNADRSSRQVASTDKSVAHTCGGDVCTCMGEMYEMLWNAWKRAH